ncbi:uncharacterized protein K02A2.6-like [Leguminivora glycinivorella]|uniref:uncharacterized protein K02A2.6-like n=1 Tax=Leguminivora glycinivorella TaxID=1035111 RepID=UPI00200E3B9F|nr:uncharacterized protein K02A2.6-like [Leguminivora glycinivorella]
MLHEPHMGIVKSKALARSYVWWPGIDEAVERMCRECNACALQADAPPKQAPCMWLWPDRQWSRIHLDFMGPIAGKTYLVVIDAMSKWVEIFHMTSTTATAVITTLCELFSRWGIPKQIVSDNGPPFSSTEMRNFSQGIGVEHIFSAPYHPASNGLADITVKTLKKVIKKALYEKNDVNKALWTYLLYYRNTIHPTTGQSPAMLLQGRKLRTKLDTLKPDIKAVVHKAQQRQKLAAGGTHRELGPQEEVWYRQYLKGEKWAPGQVVDKTGSGDYNVKGADGSVFHRHVDQLKRRSGRQSLVYSVPETLDIRTNPSNGVACNRNETNEETRTESVGGSAAPGSDAVVSSEHASQPISSPSKSPHGSPIFQDASPSALASPDVSGPSIPSSSVVLPSTPSPPRGRPFRQCRLKGITRLDL